jgi:hypothetical protein
MQTRLCHGIPPAGVLCVTRAGRVPVAHFGGAPVGLRKQREHSFVSHPRPSALIGQGRD